MGSLITIAALLVLTAGGALPQAAGKMIPLSDLRIQECRQASEALIAAFRDGRDFNSRDQRLLESCRPAMAAQDAGTVASFKGGAGTRGISREMLTRVLESANRMVAEFNDTGVRASYTSTDLRNVEAFSVAVAAVDCLASGSACPQAEVKKILTEFNARGGDAEFDAEAKGAVREFQERKAEAEEDAEANKATKAAKAAKATKAAKPKGK